MPELAALREQAAELTTQIEALSQSVGSLARKQRQDHTVLRAITVGLALYVVALALIGVVALRANSAANEADDAHTLAESNKTAARLSCEAGNQGRATQIELWTVVLNLAVQTNPAPTREQALQIAQFRTYIQKVFTPRDCSRPVQPTTPIPTPTGTR